MSRKRKEKRLIEEIAVYAKQCVPKERLKDRWNLTSGERSHVNGCSSCKIETLHLFHDCAMPAERRAYMRKALKRGTELTLAEIKEMVGELDFMYDEKKYQIENGQRVIEEVHTEDCPCILLSELLTKTLGQPVDFRKKLTLREKVGRWLFRSK